MNIEDYKERKKMAWQGWQYAIQRIDLLIISINGAGIYVVLESLKFFFEKNIHNNGFLKFAGLLFVFSIIINIISQLTGKIANEIDIRWSQKQIDYNCKPKHKQKLKLLQLDQKATCYTNWTDILNILSLISLFAGLILLIFFIFITL